METISLKLEKGIMREIDRKLARNRYSTRTEFIRDAIREKLSDLERDEMLRELTSLKEFSRRKTSDKSLHQAREKAFQLLERQRRS